MRDRQLFCNVYLSCVKQTRVEQPGRHVVFETGTEKNVIPLGAYYLSERRVDKECKVFIALNNTGLLHQFCHQSQKVSSIAYLVKLSIISIMIDKDRNNYASYRWMPIAVI